MIQPNQVLKSCESTNKLLRELLIQKNAQEGDWIRSLTQSLGLGRQGRVWVSPSGGFYFSHILKINNYSHISWVPLWVGVRVIKVLLDIFPQLPLKLKWPNDLYLKNKKCGGILCESILAEKQRYIITGIGINTGSVDASLKGVASFIEFLPKFKNSESFCQKFQESYLENISEKFLEELENQFRETQRFMDEYSFFKKGDKVFYTQNSRDIQTLWRGVAQDGAALVEELSGKIVPLYSEDVHLKKLS